MGDESNGANHGCQYVVHKALGFPQILLSGLSYTLTNRKADGQMFLL